MPALLRGAAALLVLAALTLAVLVRDPLPGERRVLRATALHPQDDGHRFWQLVSDATANIPLLLATTVLVVLLVVLGRRADAALAGVTVVLVVLLNPVLKAVVGRERPGLVPLVGDVSADSYPSGHAAASAALAAAAVVAARALARSGRWTVAALAVGLAVVVAAGQLALGRHWPSDLLAGWLLAAACTALAYAAVVAVSRRRALGPPPAPPGRSHAGGPTARP